MLTEVSRHQSSVTGPAAFATSAPDLSLPSDGHATQDDNAQVIVVGGGPSGLRVAQELARRDIPLIQFNAERWRPYNRLKLTPFLAGEVQIGIVYQPNAIEGLSVRVDYYSVIIEDNIQQAGAQTVVTGCYQQSDPFLCSLITRGGAPSTENPAINYISLIGGESLGDRGRVPPFWGPWAPNLIFGVIALWGLTRIGKETATARTGGWGDWWSAMREFFISRRARRAA